MKPKDSDVLDVLKEIWRDEKALEAAREVMKRRKVALAELAKGPGGNSQ
jgi:predicted RNA binding protein with dsRBD fold (UPF0201 family)